MEEAGESKRDSVEEDPGGSQDGEGFNLPHIIEDGGRGPGGKGNVIPEEGKSPRLTASKKMTTSVLQLQETKFCQQFE